MADNSFDSKQISDLFAKSFASYPLCMWLLDSIKEDYCARFILFHTLFTQRFISEFQVSHNDDYSAAAVWIESEKLQLLTKGDWTELYRRYRHALGIQTAKRLLRFHIESAAHHSSDAHDYLFLLAVSPERQGVGLGSRMLAPKLEQANRCNRNLILETSSASNLRFYARYGFQVVQEYEIAPSAPMTWVMERPPVAQL